jgi:hypothetical protein
MTAMRIGVLAVQGGFAEHIDVLREIGDGVHGSAMAELAAWTAWADNVVTFYAEAETAGPDDNGSPTARRPSHETPGLSDGYGVPPVLAPHAFRR